MTASWSVLDGLQLVLLAQHRFTDCGNMSRWRPRAGSECVHLPGRVGPGPGLHSFLLRPVTGPETGAAVPAETQCLDGKYGHVTVTQSLPARDRPQDAEYKRWPAAQRAPASLPDSPRGWSLSRIYRRGLPSTTLSLPRRWRPRSVVCWWHHACWAKARSVKRCYAEGGR